MTAEALHQVMLGYSHASHQRRSNHPIANCTTEELPRLFQRHLPHCPNIIWRTSPPLERSAYPPWIASFHPVGEGFAHPGYCPVAHSSNFLKRVHLWFDGDFPLNCANYRRTIRRRVVRPTFAEFAARYRSN